MITRLAAHLALLVAIGACAPAPPPPLIAPLIECAYQLPAGGVWFGACP